MKPKPSSLQTSFFSRPEADWAPKGNGLAARLAEQTGVATTPHLIVRAGAGTGKTFTQIVGAGWTFGQPVWRKIETGIWKMLPEDNRPPVKSFRVQPSQEQQAIWDALAASRGQVRSVIYTAFNKAIVSEFNSKWGWMTELLKADCGVALRFATINSLGFQILTQTYSRLEVQEWRSEELLAGILGSDSRTLRRQKNPMLDPVTELVKYSKLTLAGWQEGVKWSADLVTDDELDELSSFYDIDLPENTRRTYDLVRKVLQASLDTSKGVVDFNDQNWLPLVLQLHIPRVDLVLVDEGQDLNRCRQEFCLRLGRRVILVGDTFQAIYGFAGADTESMNRMLALLGKDRQVQTLDLTETRRCCKAVVREAQRYQPNFRAHPDNPEGEVAYTTLDRYQQDLQDGDMVLCRVNAPLIHEATRLLRAGKKAIIRGRDFGTHLIKLIKKLEAISVPDLLVRARQWAAREEQKELRKKRPSNTKIISIWDRLACIRAFCEGVGTVQQVTDKMELLFAGKECPRCRRKYSEAIDRCPQPACQVENIVDSSVPVGPLLVTPAGVQFSSIHKAKGLEATNVYILRLEGAQMPHPLAKTKWEKEQELHLIYVAITRTINKLTWVTDET